MWLIFQCTSEERVGRYLVGRRHVLTSWWCSCHSEFTSLALSVFPINTRLAVSKLGWRNTRKRCKFRFRIETCLKKLFLFLPSCNRNLYSLFLILDSFTPTFHNTIPIFSSHNMYMFIRRRRIFMRPYQTIVWRIKKKRIHIHMHVQLF